MKRCFLLGFLAALFLAAPAAQTAGLIIVDEAHWRPGPIPPWPPEPPPRPPHPILPPVWRPHVFAPLEIHSCKVNGKVEDQVAVTTIDQEFYNPNNARLEGTFLFPVPKGAQLDHFAMEIEGKKVEAELLVADKARSIYEDIVRRAKDPALMEYSGRDVFKVRIFPIEPLARKRVTVRYTQLLKLDNGLVSYAVPLNTAKYSSQPIKSVSVKLQLASKRPIKTIYSPSHAVEIKRDGARRATVGHEGSNVVPDTDLALYFAPEKDELGVNLLTHRVAGEDGYFLLLASPGVDVKENNLVKKDVVFVLDTSGSMAGKKLEQAKKALQFCVENLNDGDRFELVRFSTEVEPLFDKLVTADNAHRERANEFIAGLKPIGGTAMDDALKKALSCSDGRSRFEDAHSRSPSRRPFMVIFLTDGLPTIGTTDEQQILDGVKKSSDGTVRVFCFGIGHDVNTHLLDKITEQTRAVSQYVLPDEDLEVKLSNFFAKIKEPVLANPTLKFTGGIRITKLYPSPLPDLFKGEQLVLVGRYSGKGESAVVIEGMVNGESRKFASDVKFAGESSENEFIARLWATRRVGHLLDEIRLHGENKELKDEVTELARQYGLVTPYTAYLILEDEARRGVPMALQSMPQLREDRLAMDAMKDFSTRYEQERSGGLAVNAARANYGFKSAGNVAEAANGFADANRSLTFTAPAAAAPASSSLGRTVPGGEIRNTGQFAQNSQFVNGRNFYQNGNQWVDASVQQSQRMRRVRLLFNSPEYFAFAATNTTARPWLALGNNVQFVLKDTIYEIYE